MFRCPECGADTSVNDSRPTMNGLIRRRRRCRGCSYRFSTLEIAVDDYADTQMYFRKNVTKMMNRVKMLHESLGTFLSHVTHTDTEEADKAMEVRDVLQGPDSERVGQASAEGSRGDKEG